MILKLILELGVLKFDLNELIKIWFCFEFSIFI